MDKGLPPRPRPPKNKGTVTSLASMFPAEEAQKASQRVQDTLAERQKQLDQLREFVADNASLINLVQRLPDELHHNIMVPFGKAAFFPGKLIRTNEFMVLLGEGYYAERTSKQTVDILKRRGKELDTQMEAVKAVMQDLKAEASFFKTTASEAAEGLVEIREEYVEEASLVERSAAGVQKSDSFTFLEEENPTATVEDEEYKRIFSRMAELEKEEEEAENARQDDKDEKTDGVHHSMVEHESDEEVRSSVVNPVSDQVGSQVSLHDLSEGHSHGQLQVEGRKHLVSEDGFSHDKDLAFTEANITKKSLKHPEPKESIHANRTAKEEVSTPNNKPSASSKAFTGTIVERAPNFEMNAVNQQTVGRSSKPVSRFKLQRK